MTHKFVFVVSLIFSMYVAGYTDQDLMQIYKKRYGQSVHDLPQFGFGSSEQQLHYVLQLMDFETSAVTQQNLKRRLEKDKEQLTKIQSDNYYLFHALTDAAQKDRYWLATQYLTNCHALEQFLLKRHETFLRGQEILYFYQTMQEGGSLIEWIELDKFKCEKYPFFSFKEKAKKDLEFIQELMQSLGAERYHQLGAELEFVRRKIDKSLQVVVRKVYYDEEKKESDEFHKKTIEKEHRRIELESQKIQEQIENNRRIVAAQESLAQTQKNSLREQEKLHDVLLQLIRNLENKNLWNLQSQTNEENLRLQNQAENCRLNLERLLTKKKDLVQKATQNLLLVITILKIESQNRELVAEIKRKKNDERVTLEEVKNWQRMVEDLSKMKNEQGSHKLSSSQAYAAGEQHAHLPMAQARVVDADDGYTGSVVTATLIPENEPQQIRQQK